MTPDPASIGRFDVRARLGQGGMSVVYLAVDNRIDRLVALKLLRVNDQDVHERFLREARAAGRLQHPNIVTIFEVGDHEGQPFIAMEYISGETLAETIARCASLSVARKIVLIQNLCDGLECAHQAGIIHRDVKPANLMVSGKTGVLKILDFGVARLADGGGGTTSGLVLGTPSYMSPEQIEGGTIGIRSDIFSVGAVLYELLLYRKAFAGETYEQLRQAILHDTRQPMTRVKGLVSPEFEQILRRALAREPADRYANLSAMRADLARAAERFASAQNEATIAYILPAQRTHAHDTPRGGNQPEKLNLEEDSRAQEEDLLVQLSLDAGRDRLQAGDFSEARRHTDEALRLRPKDPSAQALRQEVEAAALAREREGERARTIADSIERARAALKAGAFELAIRAANEVFAFESDHAGAAAVKARAVQALEERRRQAALDSRAQSEIDSARVELEAGHPTNAIRRLQQFTPEHPLIRDAVIELRQEIDAQLQRRREEDERQAFDTWFATQTADLRTALSLGHWGDAEAVLDTLRTRGERVPELDALATELSDARLAAQRDAIADALRLAERALESQDFDIARDRCDSILTEFPREHQAMALLGRIRQARRSAALRGLSTRASDLGEAVRRTGRAAYRQLRRLAEAGRQPIGRRLSAVGHTVNATLRTRAGQGSAAVIVLLLVGGLWWTGSRPGPGEPQRPAEALVQRGELVQATEVIEDSRLLATLVSQARNRLSSGGLQEAADLGQQARSTAPDDATVASLVKDIWDAANSQSTAARDSATTAGGTSLAPFQEGRNLRGTALQLYEGGDLVAAVGSLTRSATLFEDAAAEAAGNRLARVEDIALSAQTLLEAGQFVDAVSEAERGLALMPGHRDLTLLASDIVSAAESAAFEAQAAVPRSGLTSLGAAESLVADARTARDDGDRTSAVTLFLDATVRFRAAAGSIDRDVTLALGRGATLLRAGELEQAAQAIVQLLNAPLADRRDPRGLDLVTEIRNAAADRATAARGRGAANTGHPAYAIASEQEAGARLETQSVRLVEAVQYYLVAERYYDEAADAVVVEAEAATLLDAWETAFDAQDEAALLELYPDQERDRGFLDWVQERSADWTLNGCAPIRLTTGNAWQTTCRVTIIDRSETHALNYTFTFRESADAWVFRDIREQER